MELLNSSRRTGALILLTVLALDADAAVGSTQGVAQVTPRGEAAYSIPLRLPPGTNGLTPTLLLEYRHRQPAGLLGAGWSITGLSRIERCARTLAQDGVVAAVKYSSADRFCLDGKRLVVVNGSPYGAAGAEYRTEVESFSRIRSWGSAGAGPAYWVVEAPDGRVLEYGATADSRIDGQAVQGNGAITAHSWALNRIRDRLGNAMTFEYTETAPFGSYRIAAIRYNQNPNAGITASHVVSFVYETRSSSEIDPYFAAGAPIRQIVRLDRIDVLYNAAVVRRYDLGYEPMLSSAGRSRIASIQECGAGGTDCLAPTTFTWQNGTASLGAEVAVAASTPVFSAVATDINGDGRKDLAWAGGSTTAQTVRYRLALAGGGFGPEMDTGVATLGGCGAPLDYNGDGFGDLVTVSTARQWLLIPGNAGGLGAPVVTGIAVGNVADFRGADMNGDGLDDLAYSDTDWQSLFVRVHYAQPGGTFSAQAVVVYDQAMATGYQWPEGGAFLGAPGQRIDLDGDGREDLLMDEYYTMARISADEATSDHFDSSFYGGTPADINGDGCTDFVYPHYTGRWRVRFSGCSILNWAAPEYIGPPSTGLQYSAATTDWNGDGKDDLFYRTTAPAWQVVLSNGGGLLPAVSIGIPHGGATGIAFADFNGDGLRDALTTFNGQFRVRQHGGSLPDLLLAATDGFGVAAAFEYAPLTAGLHTRLSGATYPDRDIQDTRQVVAALSVSDGSGTGALASYRYRYEGLRVSSAGRGDLGFAKFSITEGSLGHDLHTEDVYRQDFPFIGLTARQTTRRASGLPVRDVAHQWSSLSYDGGTGQRRFPYLASVTDRRYAVGGAYDGTHYSTATTTVAAIDRTSGFITDRTFTVTEVATGLNAGSSRSQRLLHSSLLNDTVNWCLGRPQATQVTVGHTLPGGGDITRSLSQSWDGLQCRPVQQQIEPGNSQLQVTIGLGYDNFGNLSSRTVTGAGMSPRTSTLGFGPRGQLPVTASNALGQVTTLGWDYALGLPVAMTDPNMLITQWGYDGFGRPASELRPDQTRTTWEHVACSGCDPRTRYLVHVREQDSAGVIQQTRSIEFDQFGRPYRVATQLPGGGVSVTVSDSDARGRPSRLHLPRWQGGPAEGYRQFGYDPLGRIIAETAHDGAGTTVRSMAWTHNGLTATFTDARGNASTLVSSAWGDIVRATDAQGGNTGYQHDGFGNLTLVTDPLNNLVSAVTYNVRGMKTRQDDLDLGTWVLTRNALGELVSQVDAKNQLSTFTYDALSRPLTRLEPEGLTTWTWGSSAAARNVGQLAAVAGPGYSEAYAYDSWARLATRTITSDATYQYAFAYNSQGLLDTLTYPVSTGGYRLKLGFDYAAGQPVRVRDRNAPATVLWELTAQDAAGRVVQESLGTTIAVVTGFDPLTGLMEYRQTGVGGGSALQNLAYQWDAADNLTMRQDLNQGLTESFEYDALDRLVQARPGAAAALELRYDAIGNLTWKSDVGQYAYHPGKRHAATSAGQNGFAYDANGNMTQRNGAALSWFSYNLPATLRATSGSQSQFWYAPDRGRWKQVASAAGTTETTIYIGGLMEKVTAAGGTSYRHYIPSPTGVAALYLRRPGGNPAEATYYLTQDHLGSTDQVLNAAGVVVAVAHSYDAFGRRRGSGWPGPPAATALTAISQTTRDGFTGHEHLDHLELIHMNGRVYDPVVARFLSADPYVQAPLHSQSLNRYSYVWNNPLSLVDPSGFEGGSPADGGGKWLCRNGNCSDVLWWLFRGQANDYSQVISAAERDPCGMDGSAMACHRPRGGPVAASEDPHAAGAFTPAARSGRLLAEMGSATLDAFPGWYYSGQAATSISNRNYLLAVAFYGAMTADVFSGGSGSKVTTAVRGTAASAGGVVRRFRQQGTKIYYRVYSGDATRGRWLTAVPFKSSTQAQEALALPPWNSAAYVQEVLVPNGTLLERSRAIPVHEWDRFRGGAEQFRLLEEIPYRNFGPGKPLP